MPSPDPGADQFGLPDGLVTNIVYGLVGAILSLLFGGHELTAWQRFGCVISGLVCAVLFGPLVLLVWPNCPPSVVSVSGFVMGLGGLYVVRLLLGTWKLLEARLPRVFVTQIEKRITGGAGSDPVPPPPAPPVSPGS